MNDFEKTKLCAEALRGDDKSITIMVSDGHVWNQWDDGSWAQNPHKVRSPPRRRAGDGAGEEVTLEYLSST